MASRSSSTVVAAALRACRLDFAGVGLFSAAVNLLMLTGPLYMLQVYDRVLASRSVATLIGLSLIAFAAYLLQGALEALRGRMLARIGFRFDEAVSDRVHAAVTRLPLAGARPEQAMQPIRDLDQMRGFLSGLGPTALFDIPWVPVFLAACFLLHPWLGLLAVGGGGVITALMLLTEASIRGPTERLTVCLAERHRLAETSRRNSEALKALGMRGAFAERWRALEDRLLVETARITDAGGGLGATAKVFRMMLQSAVLGLGAWLAIRQEVSAGAMIAASIMISRTLAPIELAVAHWRSFVAARQSYRRLAETLGSNEPAAVPLALPAPRRSLSVEELTVAAPGSPRPILRGLGFRLEAGQGIGVIGPSASGKSTLARALAGVWTPLRGCVRLDGAALDQWESDALGRHVGYLPQSIELFEGTVAENIARFDTEATAEAVISAAQVAGADAMIRRLAEGYDTRIGENGAILSGGQRQRIALARALYRDPFLVVLDEPNANLDSEGDAALTAAIRSVRLRGGIIVVITHRPAGIAGVDNVLVLSEGTIKAFGPKDKALRGTGIVTLHRGAAGERAPGVLTA